MLSASLIQLEYASKQWKSTFSYSSCSSVDDLQSLRSRQRQLLKWRRPPAVEKETGPRRRTRQRQAVCAEEDGHQSPAVEESMDGRQPPAVKE